MATYSNNTTIKIGSMVTFYNGTVSGTVSNSYTVPSGSYILIHTAKVNFSGGGTAYIRAQRPSEPATFNLHDVDVGDGYRLPSGTIITMQATGFGGFGGNYNLVGQLFSNTP